MKFAFNKRVVTSAAIIAALLNLAPFTSAVICVAPNGHVALEYIAALCCQKGHDRAGNPELSYGAPGPCDGCTDYIVIAAGDRSTAAEKRSEV